MDNLSCENIRRKIEKTKEEIGKIEGVIGQLPEGELLCFKNENRYKWFWKIDGCSSYLAKENRELAEKLALKKYYVYQLEELIKKLEVYEHYLRKMGSVEGRKEQLLYHKEWSKLLAKYFRPVSSELESWQQEDYAKCKKHEDGLIYKGTQGKMLRSKSEVIIDRMLYEKNIPFRYEDKLILNGTEIYPDFTIRHPITGKTIYWEHFGLMDDAAYRNSFYSKIKLYCENEIIPSINLIITYETKKEPLNIEHIENIIKEYF